MYADQQKIKSILTSLIAKRDYFQLKPATHDQIEIFKNRAFERKVDSTVIEQLVDLYKVADFFYYEIVLGFHSCTDLDIFEWWDDKELWIGQRDFYTIRWANNKFCLGEPSTISFSEEYEFDTLIQLIEGCIEKEIKVAEDYNKLNN